MVQKVVLVLMLVSSTKWITMAFSYRFPVHIVNSCPTKQTRDIAAALLECEMDMNNSLNYFCVPNQMKTHLLEFCYDEFLGYVQNGNCLLISTEGYLIKEECSSFAEGCPDQPYLSSDIYQYPKCQEIDKRHGCFIADPNCVNRSVISATPPYDRSTSMVVNTKNFSLTEENKPGQRITITVVLIFVVLVIIILPAVIIYCKSNLRSRKSQYDNVEMMATLQESPRPSSTLPESSELLSSRLELIEEDKCRPRPSESVVIICGYSRPESLEDLCTSSRPESRRSPSSYSRPESLENLCTSSRQESRRSPSSSSRLELIEEDKCRSIFESDLESSSPELNEKDQCRPSPLEHRRILCRPSRPESLENLWTSIFENDLESSRLELIEEDKCRSIFESDLESSPSESLENLFTSSRPELIEKDECSPIFESDFELSPSEHRRILRPSRFQESRRCPSISIFESDLECPSEPHRILRPSIFESNPESGLPESPSPPSSRLHDELRRNFLQWLMSKHKKIKVVRLYFGEQDFKYWATRKRKNVIVLVIDESNVITDEDYHCNGESYNIICRLWKIPPVEGIKVTKCEIGKILDNNVLSTIEKCIGNRSNNLFKRHSNLEIITMSPFRSKNNGDDIIDEPCIVFYCSCKGVVPINEEKFPKHLDDIPTDVREGFFYQFPGFLRGSTEVLDPLRMGAIISRKDQPSNGTLGGFVTMDSGDIGFITAAHVFKTVSGYFTSDDNFDVVQPSRGFFGANVCGVNARSFVSAGLFDGHTIDAALVRITSRKPTRGLFAGMNEQQLKEAGYSLEMLPEYYDAAIRDFRQEHTNRLHTCVKFGASTGLTRGTLCLNGICVKWTDDFITLGNLDSVCDTLYFKQLQIQGHQNLSFAQPGDSGALVFQIDSDETNGQRLVCIGMVVGGTSDNKTVVTPIVPILNALKVQMHQFNTINMDES